MKKMPKQPVVSFRKSRKVTASTVGSLLAALLVAGGSSLGLDLTEASNQLATVLAHIVGTPLLTWVAGYVSYETEDPGPDGDGAEAPEDGSGVPENPDSDDALDEEVQYDQAR